MSNPRRDRDNMATREATGSRGIEKLLPQNLEAEAGVLGSLLIDPEAVTQVRDFLNADDFYREAHRAICEAIYDLYDSGQPADLITLTDELARRGKLDDLGGISYVSSLANQVPTSANVEYYAHIVERTSILRRLIHAAGQIAAVAYNEPDAGTALDQAEKLVFDVAQRHITSTAALVRLSSPLQTLYDRLENMQGNKDALAGLPTKFKRVDELLGGLRKQALYLFAARPGVGKTGFALATAYNLAKQGYTTLLFSLEMSAEELALRFLSMEAGVDSRRLGTGFINDDEWGRVSSALGVLCELPILIDDTSGLSINEIRTRARRAMLHHQVDCIMVDYLQLVGGSSGAEGGGRFVNRVQEIGQVSRGLKGLARQLNIPVLALTQMSREVEKRAGHEPQLSDLRESGDQEQDADMVAFLHRDDLNNPESDKKNIVDILVRKNRHGPLGTASLFSRQECHQLRDLALTYSGGVDSYTPSDSEWGPPDYDN